MYTSPFCPEALPLEGLAGSNVPILPSPVTNSTLIPPFGDVEMARSLSPTVDERVAPSRLASLGKSHAHGPRSSGPRSTPPSHTSPARPARSLRQARRRQSTELIKRAKATKPLRLDLGLSPEASVRCVASAPIKLGSELQNTSIGLGPAPSTGPCQLSAARPMPGHTSIHQSSTTPDSLTMASFGSEWPSLPTWPNNDNTTGMSVDIARPVSMAVQHGHQSSLPLPQATPTQSADLFSALGLGNTPELVSASLLGSSTGLPSTATLVPSPPPAVMPARSDAVGPAVDMSYIMDQICGREPVDEHASMLQNTAPTLPLATHAPPSTNPFLTAPPSPSAAVWPPQHSMQARRLDIELQMTQMYAEWVMCNPWLD